LLLASHFIAWFSLIFLIFHYFFPKTTIAVYKTLIFPGAYSVDKEYRLKKEDLSKVVENEDLFLTYDMGHELEEFGKINYPDNHIFNKIRNIHIHDSNDGIDHYPIYNSSINFNIILNGIKYLKDNNYKYNIVYEYDLYKCSGDTIIDKVKDYLNSIENIK
jgi:hypothetical protein